MKKILVLLIALLLTIMISGCSINTTSEDDEADKNSSKIEKADKNQEEEQDEEEQDEEKQEEQEEQEETDYTKLVEAYVSESGVTKDSVGDVQYNFTLPKILDKSEDADKINSIIENRYGEEIKKIVESSDNSEVKYYDIDWKSYWSSNIVSIVISAKLNAAQEEERLVFTYNFETKQILENDDILKYVGLEEDEFISLAKNEMIKKYDSSVIVRGYDYEELVLMYTLYLPLRSYIVSSFNADDMYLYLEDDSLKMIAESYSPEIPGAYYCEYSIEADKNKKYPKKEISDDFIRVRLEENKVFIALDSALKSEGYLTGLTESDANKEHEVEGLYGAYKDIKIGVIGQDYNPMLVLTKEDNSLEMVNVFDCARSKKFVSMPLFGLYDIKEVYGDIVEFGEGGYTSIIAKDASSNSYDLSDWLFASAFSFSSDFVSSDPNTPYVTVKSDDITHSTQSGGEYTSTYELKIAEIEIVVNDILTEVGISTNSLLQNLNCLGMNDEGICYNYTMFETIDDGTEVIKNGCMVVKYCSALLDAIEVKVLHGTELFDSPNKWIKFSF